MDHPKLRIRRATLHIITGLGILTFLSFYPYTHWLIFFALLIGIVISFLSTAIKIPIISFFLNNFELERHKKEFPGKSFLFFLAGSLLVIKLFTKDISFASIAILTFADPVSYFVSNFKQKRTRRKTLLGIFLAMITAIIAASFFVPLKYAIPAGFFAMLAEAFIIKVWEDHIDDNFLIPIVAGTTIHICRIFF